MNDKMEGDSENKTNKSRIKENPHLGKSSLADGIPSHIFCEVLHVIPQQIFVGFQWKESTYKGF